jgi:hypothetical protein
MLLILFLSTTTFFIDLAILFICFDFEDGGSFQRSVSLDLALHFFLGTTHLTADGLLVRFHGSALLFKGLMNGESHSNRAGGAM